MSDRDALLANEGVIRRMEDAFNRRDFAALAACYDDKASHQGVEATRADFVRVFEGIADTFPDWVTTIDRIFAQHDWVIELITCTGTHSRRATVNHHGDLRGVGATGKTFSVKQSHYWRLREGLIVEHEVVRDDLGLHRQLGLAPSRPGSDRG